MNLTGKKVLVTGADGFIGSHLVERLMREGCSVRAFVYYNALNSWGWLDTLEQDLLDSIEVMAGDIRDPYFVREAVRGTDVVMHLAALIAIPYSYRSPDLYVDTNVRGTLNLLQAARDFGVGRFIHTSTSEVYGTAQYVPIDENHPLVGQSPYSATKIGADQLALSFYHSFELPVSIIRPFNTYGPRQSARAVIPTIITQLASGRRKIKLGSLHPTRDFNYVADTVDGFVAMAKSDEVIGEVVNVSSNYEISIGETAALIAKIMNVDIEIETDDARVRPPKSEVERLWGDNRKARRLLDWEPRYAGLEGLEKGLRETIAWFADPQNLRAYKEHLYNI